MVSFQPINRFYNQRRVLWVWVIVPLILFTLSFSVRLIYFQGFILGDDAEEFGLIESIYNHGPTFKGYLQYRFSLWIFNVLFFKLFGISELVFFLPTLFMSASLCVIGYYIFEGIGYSTKAAFWGGVFIATAPFEILVGTSRTNDLILSWFLALGLLSFLLLQKRPVAQGLLMAVFLWLAFYDKIWAVYILPGLGIYYYIVYLKRKEFKSLLYFSIGSLVLHGLSGVFWIKKMGVFLPYTTVHPQTFPVKVENLPEIWKIYPNILLNGSEFGTTLYGSIPYILLVLLVLKSYGTLYFKDHPEAFKWDRFDILLFGYYFTFFLFLEFFPNSFKFDQYYSSPRIFRYTIPLSFPMTFHVAKILFDGMLREPGKSLFEGRRVFKKNYLTLAILPLIALNLFQAFEATEPGRTYRKALLGIVAEIKKNSSKEVVVETWLGYFFRKIYFREEGSKLNIKVNTRIFHVKDYENWISEEEGTMARETLLVTGIGSNVHYGAHYDGIRLAQFENPLNPGWKLVKEFENLSYLPVPENARLWKWTGKKGKTEDWQAMKEAPGISGLSPFQIFKAGMDRFENNDCEEAKVYFSEILNSHPSDPTGENALYFRTICVFREGDWEKTIREFGKLIHKYPEGIWVAGAHYHRGISYLKLKRIPEAREEFGIVINTFPKDESLVSLSKERLNEIKQL